MYLPPTYTAGCTADQMRQIVADVLGENMAAEATITITDDVMGSAGRQMRVGWLVRIEHWSLSGGYVLLTEAEIIEMTY